MYQETVHSGAYDSLEITPKMNGYEEQSLVKLWQLQYAQEKPQKL